MSLNRAEINYQLALFGPGTVIVSPRELCFAAADLWYEPHARDGRTAQRLSG